MAHTTASEDFHEDEGLDDRLAARVPVPLLVIFGLGGRDRDAESAQDYSGRAGRAIVLHRRSRALADVEKPGATAAPDQELRSAAGR